MFDLGDLRSLSPKDLLKITHIFVTHTHMDHFIGFDDVIRVCLGRDKDLYLFGPPDFFQRVEGRLAGYTWNLVSEYTNDFRLFVTEVHEESLLTREYVCRDSFLPFKREYEEPFSGTLLMEPHFHVEAEILDHRIPCLGFSLVENFYVNILKDRLADLDLEVGPWINRFKKAIYEERDLDDEFSVTWEENGNIVREKKFALRELVNRISKISQGQRITYICDVIGSQENRGKIYRLALNADYLFIEAAFMDRDIAAAHEKYHLTAREAGEIARDAGARHLEVFHFSPRYNGNFEEIYGEAMDYFKE